MNNKLNKILLVLGIIIIVSLIVFLIIQTFKEDDESLHIPNDFIPTYEFSGESEHFKFNVGKVYYGKDYSRIYIGDFQQTKKINNLKDKTIKIYFNDKLWASDNSSKYLNKLNKTFYDVEFDEAGATNCEIGECEISYFSETSKETFKDAIKIEIKYCLKDNKCETETFNIKFNN